VNRPVTPTPPQPRSYAHARVAVAPGDSTSSLREGASATRRWTREETRARATGGPEFRFPSPDRSQLDALVADYERITASTVRRLAQRNLIATCYRVHGYHLLPLVLEWFDRTGTTTNLLGELRRLPPRDSVPAAPTTVADVSSSRQGAAAKTTTRASERVDHDAPRSLADAESAWCGCPEEGLRPGVLYCSAHYRYGYAGKLRLDRRESNPAAARFFAERAGRTESALS
jgi:hypothetical protein